MLDHPKNDIYIHMDAKNKFYNPDEITRLAKFSKIFHVKRIKVTWGGYSLIESELILLEAAVNHEHYEHYHLLSGSDLPIKKQEDIINFFEAHHGVEFLFCRNLSGGPEWCERPRYYYFFQEKLGLRRYNGSSRLLRILNKMNNLSLRIQKKLHLYRHRKINFGFGSQWFSITDELARYILSKRKWIRRTFHNTRCCDEIFLQTIIINSDFRNKIFDDKCPNMRFIDWQRGSPYTFTINELDELRESNMLFARKFDPVKDEQIILKIQELYS